MNHIEIHTDSIQLNQLLKWAGIIDSGGAIKRLIENKLVYLNGTLVTEQRKKIILNDIVTIKENGTWKVVKYQDE